MDDTEDDENSESDFSWQERMTLKMMKTVNPILRATLIMIWHLA